MRKRVKEASVIKKSRVIPVGVITLRERMRKVTDNDRYFEEACKLRESVFESDKQNFPNAKAYDSDVTQEHCEQIEDLLEQIIYGTVFGGSIRDKSFVPTPRESLLLLTAVYLHGIGLKWGLFPEEMTSFGNAKPQTEAELTTLVKKRGERACRYFTETWNLNCTWSKEDRQLLGELCQGMVAGADLDSLPEADDTHDGVDRSPSSVNLRKLAALLRLAVACRIHSGFCSLDLRARLCPADLSGQENGFLGVTPENGFLGVTRFVQDLHLEHGTNCVVLTVLKPKAIDHSDIPTPDGLSMPLTLDVRPCLEFLRAQLESIVSEVAPVLSGCESTKFCRVRLDEPHGDSQDKSQNGSPPLVHANVVLVHFWVLQLASITGATEAAVCFALVLYRVLKEDAEGRSTSEVPSRTKVENKCKIIEKLQPFNVLARRLASELKKLVSNWPTGQKPSPAEFKLVLKLLKGFLETRQLELTRSHEWAARHLPKFGTVILFGFSRTVLGALADRGFKGQVLVVPVDKHLRQPEAHWFENRDGKQSVFGEDVRVTDWCAEKGLKAEFADEKTLPMRITVEQALGHEVAMLVGTRAVLTVDPTSSDIQCNSCIAPIGSLSIAATVRRAGGKVYVIAERQKVATQAEHSKLAKEFAEISKSATERIYRKADELLERKDVDGWFIPDIAP